MADSKKYENIVVVIPALNPDDKLQALTDRLWNAGLKNIVLIDDGSSPEHKHYFSEIESEYGCTVLKHYINMGKGRALKDAFNYVLNSFPRLNGVITADSDGQHSVEDILKCADLLLEKHNDKCMLLGVRDFNASGIPARSRFGNKVTSAVLKILCGIGVSDTQTGLRGLTKDALVAVLDLQGERYEYEMNMIIETPAKGVTIEEYSIQTIYIDDNATSHFNPLTDSFLIYKQFFKYMLSSISSFCLDLGLFTLFSFLLKKHSVAQYILIATYIARLFSSIFNFTVNRKAVFKSEAGLFRSACKYFALCIIQGTLSGVLVSVLYSWTSIYEVLCKIIVDTILFFISFYIQKMFVFKEKKK
jgi:glycosyltransferase involved in cell wall biosynthesis